MTNSYAQAHITDKIAQYLKIQHRDRDYIEKFKEGGYCYGLTVLWLYCKLRSTKPVNYDSYGKMIPRDDFNWFKSMAAMLINWDGHSKLRKENHREICRFISLIESFQNPELYHSRRKKKRRKKLYQPDIHRTIEDTHNHQFKRETLLKTKLDQFATNTKLEELVQENKMLIISSEGHATGLIQIGRQYHFYDSNDDEIEILSDNLDDITEEAFKALEYDFDDESHIEIIVISEEEKPQKKPKSNNQKSLSRPSLFSSPANTKKPMPAKKHSSKNPFPSSVKSRPT